MPACASTSTARACSTPRRCWWTTRSRWWAAPTSTRAVSASISRCACCSATAAWPPAWSSCSRPTWPGRRGSAPTGRNPCGRCACRKRPRDCSRHCFDRRRAKLAPMTVLSVNVNKVAVLRNSRGGNAPDVVRAARACLDAGAHGITVHPRPDARHIRADDVLALAKLCQARGVEFNIEGNPFAPPREGYPGFHALCGRALPAQATRVPDGDAQLTSDHGFDFAAEADRLRPHVAALKQLGCRVSLFADAGAGFDAEAAAATGADRIEIY